MKTFLLASVALIALGTVANAADLAPKAFTKAPAAAPVFSWTGFYLAAGGGYGLWEADQQTTSASLFGGAGSSVVERSGGRGYFGTVSGGYDYQFNWLNSAWVAGLFADAQFGDIKGTFDSVAYMGTTKNDLNYAVGARLGYLIAPNALSYVNAGYSHADYTSAALSSTIGGPAVLTTPKLHRDGWFLGGGVENSLDIFGISAPGWFTKTEYRVAEYDRKTVAFAGTDASTSFKPYVQTVSTSLVYRFNSNGTPAKAADTPLYTKAPVAAPYNWTGFYLAGGGGYGQWEADEQTYISATLRTPVRMGGRGYFGTVGGGYDWQFASSWVAGVFADAQFGDLKGTLQLTGDGLGTIKNKLNYAAGARLGYLVAPNVLSYADAGYSHADFSGTDLISSTGSPFGYTTPKIHRDGWFLGGGVENNLDLFGISARGWFMKTEYRVAEYGRTTVPILSGGAPLGTDSVSFKPYVQTVSTSLVYRFNWGAPISAKY